MTATPDFSLFTTYVGRSMNPTLVEPALMEIRPYPEESDIRPGDVIFFQLPGKEVATVHRVMRLTSAGIVTRGDNNASADLELVQPPQIRGRVVAAARGSKRHVIRGGRVGLTWHILLRGWRLTRGFVKFVLRVPYRILAQSGLGARLLPGHLRPRIIAIENGGTRVARLLMGRHVIGEYNPRTHCWRITRPYRVFVNERDLPGPDPASFGVR